MDGGAATPVVFCEPDDSFLTGYEDEVEDADDAARARTEAVSRRLLGPSLTLGWL
jgi:hypothetical protein